MEAIYNFDWSVFQWVSEHLWNPFLDVVMSVISVTGEAGLLWIALGIVLVCFKKTRKAGLMMFAALIFMQVVNNMVLKPIIARPRPFNYEPWKDFFVYPNIGFKKPGSLSFPSGHTSSSVACATVLLIKHKKIGIPSAIYALLMGFSRIYLFDHYPTDVLGGLLVGIVYGLVGVLIVNLIYKAIEKKKGGLPSLLRES
ncbi:MAG: phosphatase PAP2 family protein [Oscillospiraceae bacterium]|jgi:undecaprenyl-diphosphatase|nr:phosphatase PAP2 family protein [Oscillospiraceae bacterium]